MRGFFAKKNIVLMLALLVFTLLTISAASGKYNFTAVKRILMGVVKPIESVLTGMSEAVLKAGRMVGLAASNYEENEELKKEIANLKKANIDSIEIWAENQRLRELLGFKQSQNRYILLPARVVGFNPSGLAGNIIIDKGEKDYVTRDMVVITADGLVGSVAEVYRNSARVQLILHPQTAVGGIVQRPLSRVAGIVSGNASTPDTPDLINLARDADVQDGDVILTSGFGGIYPKGLIIGTVQKVVNAEGGLLKYAVIYPAVNFSRLEEVMVITNVTHFDTTQPLSNQKAGG